MRRLTVVALLLVAVALGSWATAAAADPAPATGTTTTPSTTSSTTATAPPPASTTTFASTTTDPMVSTTAPPAGRAALRARAQAAATGAAVTIVGSGPKCPFYCFTPAQLTVAAGTTVTFTNASNADHTVVRCTPAACNGAAGGTGTDAAFTSAHIAVPVGASFQYTFSGPGTYVYYCSIHGYVAMHGTITVTAAASTTTVAPPPNTVPLTTPGTVSNPNALASTGGSVDGVIVIGIAALVAGLAAMALGSRRRTEHERRRP